MPMSGNNVSWQPWPTGPASATGTTSQQPQRKEENQQQPLHLLHGLQTYDNFVDQARRPQSVLPWASRPITTPTSPTPPPERLLPPSDSAWDRHPASSFFHPAVPSLWPLTSQPAPSRLHSMVANTPPTVVPTTATMWPTHPFGSGFPEISRTAGPALRGEPAPAFWPPASRYQGGAAATSPASPLRVFHDNASDSRPVPGIMPLQEHETPQLNRRYASAAYTTAAEMPLRSQLLLADDNGTNENTRSASSQSGGANSGRNGANKENVWPLLPWSSHRASAVLSPALGKDGRGRGSRTGSSLSDLDPNRMVGAREHYAQRQEHQSSGKSEQEAVATALAKPPPLQPMFTQTREAKGSRQDTSQATTPFATAEVTANIEQIADKAVDDVVLLQRRFAESSRRDRPPADSKAADQGSGCDRCDERDEGADAGGSPVAVLATAAATADKEEQTEEETEKDVVSVSSVMTAAAPAPPLSPLVQLAAPGFELPATGYEFELNHEGNLRELQRQKQWARAQLQSCNENNRFQHTQTTACIAAVNGHILGGYHPASLRCYGTNPDIAGLRVTMTVYGAGARSSRGNAGSADDAGGDGGDGNGPTLVLRHQIIVVHHPHQHPYYHQHHSNHHVGHHGHSRHGHPNHSHSSSHSNHTARPSASPASMPMTPAAATFSPTVPAWSSLRPRQVMHLAESGAAGRVVSSSAGPTRLAPPGVSSAPVARSLATPLPSHPHAYQAPAPVPLPPTQGRRYLFATTTVPLHGGVATRPGYRPVPAAEAVERLRRWGGRPDQGVFGNAWLVHLAIEPGHVRHVVDSRMMEQVARLTAAAPAAATKTDTAPPDVMATMRQVNERMQGLARQEGTLSIMLSNHGTQKRIARQCPDLVAMWVLAQEHL